ncbi:MAG: hypothetical protein ABSD58_02250 [Verrucomicrobiia bacterium]|jgi:hypothetical protein
MATKRIADHSEFANDSKFVHRLLEQWQPSSYRPPERQQEQDLLGWLRKRLPDVPILTQYGIAKGTADIVIEDSHLIELKLAFGEGSAAEFDRCIGQLWRYYHKWVKADRGPVYLVVVGESDAEFRDLLHVWFEEANEAFILRSPFHLIEKRP